MEQTVANLHAEARRLEAHGAAWGGGVERECREEAALLRACADELRDEAERVRECGREISREAERKG